MSESEKYIKSHHMLQLLAASHSEDDKTSGSLVGSASNKCSML